MQPMILGVIPGWCAAPDPESRDSGFDASHRPGMTVLEALFCWLHFQSDSQDEDLLRPSWWGARQRRASPDDASHRLENHEAAERRRSTSNRLSLGSYPCLQRALANAGQCCRRQDRIGIDLEMNDRGPAGLPRGRKRRRKIRGLVHHRAKAAEGARIGVEIRIVQLGGADAARKFTLLMHADGAVH